MRTPTESPLTLVLGALVLSGATLAAGAASAPLTVGVTVVRSCAVRATSLDRGSARLDLTCASGAASGLGRPSSQDKQSDGMRLRLRVPTSSFRGKSDSGLEVATVNF
jgi:hypothetical protein